MSDIDTAVKASRQIGDLLEIHFHATGRGLHEKLTSVEMQLPATNLKRARFVASVRITVVHDDGAVIKDRAGFERAVADVVGYLRLEPVSGVRPAPVSAMPPASKLFEKSGPRRRSATKRSESGLLIPLLALLLLGILVATTMPSGPPQTTTGPERPAELPQIGP